MNAFKTSLVALVIFCAPAFAAAQTANAIKSDQDKDRALIRAHIESIFQAFIDWDVEKIYATHSEDWRGFLEGSRVPIRGIIEYMAANGIDWPKEKGTRPSPNPSRRYNVKDFDVNFYSPELAVACFIGEFEDKSGNRWITEIRFRIMDVYAKRNGNWIQVASHTVVDPAWRAERNAVPASLSPEHRQSILKAREAVWRAYFSNDRAALEKLIPEEVVAIDDGSEQWSNRASILAGAKGFAESGGGRPLLWFPQKEKQGFGNTGNLFTTSPSSV